MIRSLEVDMTLQENENINMNLSNSTEINMSAEEVVNQGSTDNYEDLRNLPSINDVVLKGNRSLSDLGIVNNMQPDWNQDSDEAGDYIKNKPENLVQDASYVHTDNNFTDEDKAAIGDIPENLSDLADVEITNIQNGQTIIYDSQAQKFKNADAGTGSGDMLKSVYDTNDDGSVDKADTLDGLSATVNELNYVSGVTSGIQEQINGKADSSHTHTVSQISDFPTLGSASGKNVPTSGNAENDEVVLGNDSRLSDSRPASDVYSWAKASSKPSYNYSEINNTPPLGTASAKDYTTSVTDDSADLVTSGAVKSAINSAISGVYKPSGNKTCAELTSSLLVAANRGNVYNMSDSGTTTSDFVEGSGKPIPEGSNVAIVQVGSAYKFDILSGMVDLSNYVQKSNTSGLIKNDGTIDTKQYVEQVSGKVLSTNDYDDTAKGKVDNLGTASTKDVPTTGNASATQVVMGNDTRLTDSRPASDVYSWAKASTKPSYSKSEVGLGNVDNTSDSTKKTNFTGSIASGNTGFTTGGDVYTALQGKVNTETGKGLSTNDYTTAEKTKLSGISTGANKTEVSTTNGNIKIDNVETPVYRNYGNNTVLSTDRTPYLNRQCLTPTGFSSYVREKLIGCSVAWNQLLNESEYTGSASLTVSLVNHVLKITGTSSDGANYYLKSAYTFLKGHKYLICGIKKNTGMALMVYSNALSRQLFKADAGTANNSCYMFGVTDDSSNSYVYFNVGTGGVTLDVEATPQLIDLTLAFGSIVADTLYAMANNGGIDWLRNHNYPIDQYTQYGYNLVSSKPSAKKCVGFNKWDEEWEVGSISSSGTDTPNTDRGRFKNFVPVFEGVTYFLNTQNFVRCAGYDVNKTFVAIVDISSTTGGATITIPSGIKYVRIAFDGSYGATYNHNICLNISKATGTPKNGDYVPYSCTTYSLGSTELRGHLIVSNGEIVAEGDVRESNGNVTRNYGIVDLGTLEWVYNSSNHRFYITLPLAKVSNSISSICAKYANSSDLDVDKTYTMRTGYQVANVLSILITDSAYTDAATFKTAMNGVYLVYELATPTTETSSPFADPMSLNGCTTEEYVDDRTIPVPVGHETQYMGQSEDVVEIPSMPQSDGKRKLIAETSGGKTQYYWEGEEEKEEDSEDISSVLHAYNGNTLSNVHARKYGKVIELAFTSTGSYEYLTGLYVAYLTAYKPAKELNFTLYNAYNIPVGGVWITTSGIIYIRSNVADATLTEIKINAMYIV